MIYNLKKRYGGRIINETGRNNHLYSACKEATIWIISIILENPKPDQSLSVWCVGCLWDVMLLLHWNVVILKEYRHQK